MLPALVARTVAVVADTSCRVRRGRWEQLRTLHNSLLVTFQTSQRVTTEVFASGAQRPLEHISCRELAQEQGVTAGLLQHHLRSTAVPQTVA